MHWALAHTSLVIASGEGLLLNGRGDVVGPLFAICISVRGSLRAGNYWISCTDRSGISCPVMRLPIDFAQSLSCPCFLYCWLRREFPLIPKRLAPWNTCKICLCPSKSSRPTDADHAPHVNIGGAGHGRTCLRNDKRDGSLIVHSS
jgi:hypothetical protein